MIPAATVNEIKRLLARGDLSQRDISQMTGVGRTSVSSIALGLWEDRLPRSVADKPCHPRLSVPPVRCPTCGGRVHPPCLLCHVRKLKAKQRHHHSQSPCAAT